MRMYVHEGNVHINTLCLSMYVHTYICTCHVNKSIVMSKVFPGMYLAKTFMVEILYYCNT